MAQLHGRGQRPYAMSRGERHRQVSQQIDLKIILPLHPFVLEVFYAVKQLLASTVFERQFKFRRKSVIVDSSAQAAAEIGGIAVGQVPESTAQQILRHDGSAETDVDPVLVGDMERVEIPGRPTVKVK